jgi:predicted RNA-binding protein YlxR (DUF448 family)
MQRDLQLAMVRITAIAGQVRLDAAERRSGRGGYLHRSENCLERFERRKVREFRSLRRQVDAGERRQLTELIRSRLATSAQLD